MRDTNHDDGVSATAGSTSSGASVPHGTVVDRSFEPIELHLPIDTFRRVPRHAAYRYEYFGGRGVLSPRPRTRNARLATEAFTRIDTAFDLPHGIELRTMAEDDAAPLADVFAAAFEREPPFAGLDDERRHAAAIEAIADTVAGRYGPLIASACHVASGADGRPFGTCLVTLANESVGATDPMRGQPHLTWLFVAPILSRRGLATRLLHRALEALHGEGWPVLFTTFLVGNAGSATWHWENGFELLPDPYSPRRAYRRGGA